jgi:cyclophilin family peptidyl-prolyl cis-trans isomerase
MTTLLAGLLVLGGQAVSGPKILVSLEGGKSFTIQLDEKNTPKTAARITELVRKGFYDGQRFHRVVKDFCVQWGDPQSKEGIDSPLVGTKGSGVTIPFEAGKLPLAVGTLGMASTGSKVGGDSQMFVVTGDMTFHNGNYAAFGKVVKGMDVVLKIAQGDKIVSMKIAK